MSGPTYRDELEELRRRYADRRTIARQLLDDAVRLVDVTVTDAQTRHEAQLAEAERQHAANLDRAEQRADRAEQRTAKAAERVRELEAMRTNLRESRETIADGVLVKITAPRTVRYDGSDSTTPRPWTLGELDALTYRLRAGGATDDTEVRFKHDHTEATIPFPEMVLEAPTKPEPIPEPAPLTRRWWTRRRVKVAGLLAVSGLVLELVLLVLFELAP